MGALYLQANLELAGVVPAAEALVDARTTLDLPSERLAELLERFASQERGWYDRPSRDQLYARLFGLGASATSDAGQTVNRAFEQLLATLCGALNRYAADQTRLGPARPEHEAAVAAAANDLVANLALRQYGNSLFASQRLQTQLQAAIAVLKDPDVQALFHSTGFWVTLERILAPNAPDIPRLVERGQAGQHLLTWLAAAPPAAGTPLNLQPAVFQWAATWLAASGLDATTQPARSVA